MRRIFIASILTFFFAASTQAQILYVPRAQSSNVSSYDGIRTVAVISGLSADLRVRATTGLFRETVSRIDIRPWDLDRLMISAVKKLLSSRFEIRDVSYDADALRKIGSSEWYSGRIARSYLGPIPHDGIDAFVVIRSGAVDFEFGETLPDDNRMVEYAPFLIEVVDARKWQVLTSVAARLNVREGEVPLMPYALANRLLTFNTGFTFSDEQRAILRGEMLRLIGRSLLDTLEEAKFGIALPGPNYRKIVATPPEDFSYSALKSVAVVSSVADKFTFHRYAFLVNHKETLPVVDWHTDAEIERIVGNTLSKRFTVQDVPVDREAFRTASLVDAKNTLNPSFPGIRPTTDVDAYLLLVKHPVPVLSVLSTITNQRSSGIGLLHLDGLALPKPDVYIYAHFAIALIDAQTLKPIRTAVGVPSPVSKDLWPRKLVDLSLWPVKDYTATAQQTVGIQQTLKEFIPDTVGETLLRMGLTDMTIVPPSLDDLAQQ